MDLEEYESNKKYNKLKKKSIKISSDIEQQKIDHLNYISNSIEYIMNRLDVLEAKIDEMNYNMCEEIKDSKKVLLDIAEIIKK